MHFRSWQQYCLRSTASTCWWLLWSSLTCTVPRCFKIFRSSLWRKKGMFFYFFAFKHLKWDKDVLAHRRWQWPGLCCWIRGRSCSCQRNQWRLTRFPHKWHETYWNNERHIKIYRSRFGKEYQIRAMAMIDLNDVKAWDQKCFEGVGRRAEAKSRGLWEEGFAGFCEVSRDRNVSILHRYCIAVIHTNQSTFAWFC